MAVIESLQNGMKLLEVIAEEGAPISMPELIRRCAPDEGERELRRAPVMTDASVRNTVETLVAGGWLQRQGGAKGGSSEYGLGRKSAALWSIYLHRGLDQVRAVNRSQAVDIEELEKLIDIDSKSA